MQVLRTGMKRGCTAQIKGKTTFKITQKLPIS
jgi:hypothetical protein